MRFPRRFRVAPALLAASAASALVLSVASPAEAQSWSAGRTRPSGMELIAIDATGEPFWPFGFEDVAGDGSAFSTQEQSIDLRTAYATTDAQRFWARVYVADVNPPVANVIVFVFLDTDDSAATGGTAAALDIHPGLVVDPSGGGWDSVLVLRGSGAEPEVWTWNGGPNRWTMTNPQAAQVVGENGTDQDPLRVGVLNPHGYLQGSAEHGLLGVDAACGTRLYVRSVVDTPEGGGDLDLGSFGACRPADANGDRVPDIAVPPTCDADDDCPFDGICQNGACYLTALCNTAADCDADEDCSADGRCVARPGASCGDDAACSSQLCVNGACATCSPGGTECGAGRRCGPDGRCVAGEDPGAGVGTGAGGSGLGPGEEVQGGACACDLTRRTHPSGAAWGGALLAISVATWRSRRRRAARTGEVRA